MRGVREKGSSGSGLSESRCSFLFRALRSTTEEEEQEVGGGGRKWKGETEERRRRGECRLEQVVEECWYSRRSA